MRHSFPYREQPSVSTWAREGKGENLGGENQEVFQNEKFYDIPPKNNGNQRKDSHHAEEPNKEKLEENIVEVFNVFFAELVGKEGMCKKRGRLVELEMTQQRVL